MIYVIKIYINFNVLDKLSVDFLNYWYHFAFWTYFYLCYKQFKTLLIYSQLWYNFYYILNISIFIFSIQIKRTFVKSFNRSLQPWYNRTKLNKHATCCRIHLHVAGYKINIFQDKRDTHVTVVITSP